MNVPVELKEEPSKAVPDSPHRYLLLNTHLIEYEAYRPRPADSYAPAYAPSVTELVREHDALAMRRWLWSDSPLVEMEEHGPLLVEITDSQPLLNHALAEWLPQSKAILIGSHKAFDSLWLHLHNLVQITLPDQSSATFNFHAKTLACWLNALHEDTRQSWLGPQQTLLWATRWYHNIGYYRIQQTEQAPVSDTGPLHLQGDEWAAFNANTQEHFVQTLAEELLTVPQYAQMEPAKAFSFARSYWSSAEDYKIYEEADVRQYFLLFAQNPQLHNDPQTERILRDPIEHPVGRLKHLFTYVGEKEFYP